MKAATIVVLASLFSISTYCAEAEQEIVIQPDITSTEDDEHILTAISFTRLGSAKQPAFKKGLAIDPVFSMQNTKKTPMDAVHVEYAIGYLSKKGSNAVLQNCTGVRYNRTLAPLETISMQYSFKPEANLDMDVYNLALRVFYVNDQRETKVKSFNVEFTLTPAERFSKTTRYVAFAIIFIAGIFFIQWMNKSEEDVEVLQTKTSETVPISSWEEIPKEHLQYVQARRGLKAKKN